VGETLRQRIKQRRFDSPAHEATLNLLVASGHVRQLVDAACEAHGITQAQYNVLRILRGAHPGGYPRGEVGGRMVERAPDVTRLIDRLERRRLAERTRTAADRRQSITRITAAGLDLLRRMDPVLRAIHRRLAARMSPRDLRELSRICELVYGEEARAARRRR